MLIKTVIMRFISCLNPIVFKRANKGTGVFILAFLLSSVCGAQSVCSDLFKKDIAFEQITYEDPRPRLDNKYGALLEIGEGNSGKVYLFKNDRGEYLVAKIYKPEHMDKLLRDHKGLELIQRLFDHDRLHSIKFRVAKSTIVENFNGTGQRVMVMPFVPGFNLHKLLVSTPEGHPLRERAEQLYNEFVKELDADAHREKIRDEFRDERDIYFQDHIVDGLKMLVLDGDPRVLIKTDNIIFNPLDNSLTLIDPY